MRVLFVTPYVPSPIRVRSYELLQSLLRLDVHLTVLCPMSPGEMADIASLRQLGVTIHAVPIGHAWRLQALVTGALAGLPLQAAYGIPAPLKRRLVDLVSGEQLDVVHIEHLRSAALLPIVEHLPVVFDAVDCISLLLERTRVAGPSRRSRWLAALERSRTRAFEQYVCDRAYATTVTSAEDAAALRALAPVAPIRVIPNGVDLDRFSPGPWPRQRDEIVFTGKMSYHANIAAAHRLVEDIMPLVWQVRPTARLRIVGSDPPRAIRRYTEDPRIDVSGRVPQLAPYLQRASVAVSPIRYGVGVQNKVLEALATATPVVTDRQCVAAIQAQVGRDLLVADDDRGFAAAILQVLADPITGQKLGMAGRQYVERHHRWLQSASMLLDVYREAIAPTSVVAEVPSRGTVELGLANHSRWEIL